MITPLIEANSISLVRGEKNILSDVSVTISPGDFHILLGPNGAGKTSLLNVLSGDIPANKGSVWLGGKPIEGWDLKALAQTRAVLPQLNQFLFPMSVYEVCALGRIPFVRSNLNLEDKRIIKNILSELDLSSYQDRDYSQLSGGEKQRVQIARILCQQTPIIFLDEPLSALDIMHQLKFLDLMKLLCAQGRSVLCVMHDVNLALRYASCISVLKYGNLLFQGNVKELKVSRKLDEALGVEVYQGDPEVLGFRLQNGAGWM